MNLRYKYAYDANGAIIDIDTVERSQHSPSMGFRCLGCGGGMIAALGDIRAHHFKHKNSENCSVETYLHLAAKSAIYSGLTHAIKTGSEYWASVTRPVHCPNNYRSGACGNCQNKKAKIDLASLVNNVSIEKKSNGFVADILAWNTDTNVELAIEVCVTNPCSPEKLASGLNIIECKIENEQDIEELSTGLSANSNDYNIDFAGSVVADHCLLQRQQNPSPSAISAKRCLILYEDGRLFILNKPFTNEFKERVVGTRFEYGPHSPSASYKILKKVIGVWGVDKAFIDQQMAKNATLNVGKNSIKTCLLCEHFAKVGPNVLENITCSKRGAKPQFEALTCSDYEPI